MAVAFTGSVFAVELGDTSVLRSPAVERAIASKWHSLVWRATSQARSAGPLLAAWTAIPTIDEAIHRAKNAGRSARDC
jgi:hypothetical protein